MLLIYNKFALKINQLTILFHSSHYCSHNIIKMLFTLDFVNESERRIHFMHQEYQVLQVYPASCIRIKFKPFVNKILIVLLSDSSRMLFVCWTKAFNDNSDKQVEHHHLDGDYENSKEYETAQVATFLWTISFEMLIRLVKNAILHFNMAR